MRNSKKNIKKNFRYESGIFRYKSGTTVSIKRLYINIYYYIDP